MDIKQWLEELTGLKAADTAYSNPPPLPYLVYLDHRNIYGADTRPGLCDHSITVELYSEEVREDLEQTIECDLIKQGIDFERDRNWIFSEGFFQTTYEFNILKKLED